MRRSNGAGNGTAMREVIRYGVAAASLGAGIIHLSAAPAHNEHAIVFAFFIGSGVLQLAWGAVAAARRMPRWFLDAGALGSALVIGTWLASRIAGLPFEGADHAEPIGIKDAVTTLLELVILSGVVALVRRRPRPLLGAHVHARALAPLATATALVVAAGIAAPVHHHDEGHTHIAAGVRSRQLGTSPQHEQRPAHAVKTTDTVRVAGARVDPSHEDDAPSPSVVPAPTQAAQKLAKTKALSATVRYGPFVLPPASLGGTAHYNRVLSNVERPCENCYLVGATPDLVYVDGRPANYDTGAMLHHAVWTRPTIDDATCGRNSAIGSQGERFFAAGNERSELRLPAGFGYALGGDAWNLIVEVMNHSEQTQTVFIELAVKYRPLSDDLREVRPVWLDVDNCKDSQFAVPAGKSHTEWSWTSTLTGRIVSAGGHVHDGGVKTLMRNETADADVCTSVAGYGGDPTFEGSIESMSSCVWDKIGTVRTGEALSVHAYYDSSKPQDDVMGIVLAFVYETSDLDGGTDPPDGGPPPEPDPPPVHEH